MDEGIIRRVAVDEAVRIAAAMPGGLFPATLDPRYVVADAAREPSLLEPVFVCFEQTGERWLHGMHVTRVPGTRWCDASSPYGYGGPVASTADDAFIRRAWSAYASWMRGQGVVVEYLRFHPLLRNEHLYPGRVLANREVVSMDLCVDDIAAAYPPRLRQTIGKAQKAGLRYVEQPLRTAWPRFAEFHREAMQAMQADAFYVFPDAYFEALSALPGAVVGYCVQQGGGEWLASGLFLDGHGIREYHLAATNAAGRKAGASSFVLHCAAAHARLSGSSELYLGGGTNAQADNPLLFFKAGFSARRLGYCTGSAVFDHAAYEELQRAFAGQWRAHPDRPIFHRKV
jgi:hypothetical protein